MKKAPKAFPTKLVPKSHNSFSLTTAVELNPAVQAIMAATIILLFIPLLHFIGLHNFTSCESGRAINVIFEARAIMKSKNGKDKGGQKRFVLR